MGTFLVILYLFCLYIRPQDWVEPFVGWPTSIILLPIGLFIGIQNYSSNKEAYSIPQNKLLPLYVFVIFLSTFVNTDFSQAYDQFYLFFQRALAFFAVLWCIKTKESLRTILTFIHILTVFIVYQAVIQINTGSAWGGLEPYFGYEGMTRAIWWGVWDGPNVVAILFVVAFTITLEYIFGKTGMALKVTGIALATCYLLGIYYTNSRGAMVTVAFLLLYQFKDKLLHPKAMISIFLAGSLLLAVAPSRITSIDSDEDSASERTWLWEQGLRYYRENPVLGIGKGQFQKRSDLQLKAHNNYVQTFAELGTAGFMLYVSLFWFAFKGNWLAARQEATLDDKLVRMNKSLNIVLVGYSAITFFVVMESDILYVLLAISTAGYVIARRDSPDVPALTYTRFDLAVVVASMLAMVVLVWLIAVKEVI